MTSKKYCLALFLVISEFFIANMVLWQTVSSNSFYGEDGHGDLSRMGMISMTSSLTHPIEYPQKHIEYSEVADKLEQTHVDILTIGDSFSNGSGGNYYQDYICSEYGVSVMNVPCRPYNDALKTFYILKNTGLLEQIKPRVIILESLTANMKERFGMKEPEQYDYTVEGFNQAQMAGRIKADVQAQIAEEKLAPGIMVKANAEFIKSWLRRMTNDDDYRFNDAVGIWKLNIRAFSNPGWEDKLLFPLSNANVRFEEQVVYNINNNLNDVAGYCEKQGIKLILLPVSDKYDVYSPYFASPPSDWRENTVINDLKKLSHRYAIIDTTNSLRKVIESSDRSEYTDLFWADDMHYSWKANQIIVKEIMQNISN